MRYLIALAALALASPAAGQILNPTALPADTLPALAASLPGLVLPSYAPPAAGLVVMVVGRQ